MQKWSNTSNIGKVSEDLTAFILIRRTFLDPIQPTAFGSKTHPVPVIIPQCPGKLCVHKFSKNGKFG